MPTTADQTPACHFRCRGNWRDCSTWNDRRCCIVWLPPTEGAPLPIRLRGASSPRHHHGPKLTRPPRSVPPSLVLCSHSSAPRLGTSAVATGHARAVGTTPHRLQGSASRSVEPLSRRGYRRFAIARAGCPARGPGGPCSGCARVRYRSPRFPAPRAFKPPSPPAARGLAAFCLPRCFARVVLMSL
jgi:hypothetical protein